MQQLEAWMYQRIVSLKPGVPAHRRRRAEAILVSDREGPITFWNGAAEVLGRVER